MPARVGRLKRARRLAVYVVSSGLFLSGAIWLYYFYFVRVNDQFGFENPHPAQGWFLILHAVFALPAVWIYGFLWQIHVKPGWIAHTRRWSGGTQWSLVLLMILTGYALYYIGNDTVRSWVSLAHWVPAVLALPLFFIHIRSPADEGP